MIIYDNLIDIINEETKITHDLVVSLKQLKKLQETQIKEFSTMFNLPSNR